jgi:hypothetical protein
MRAVGVLGSDPCHESRDVSLPERRPDEPAPESIEIEEVGKQAVELVSLLGEVLDDPRSRRRGHVLALSFNVSEKPMIEVSGVRSSCETVERIESRSSSIRLRSVMSCEVPSIRTGSPDGPATTLPRPWIHATLPSGRTTRWSNSYGALFA